MCTWMLCWVLQIMEGVVLVVSSLASAVRRTHLTSMLASVVGPIQQLLMPHVGDDPIPNRREILLGLVERLTTIFK
jgi:hypothetical protein